MANESGKNERRKDFSHWEGVNAIVDKNVAKLTDFIHVENARSKIIGTVEKREGQTVLGTNTTDGRFNARENYGLAYVSTGRPAIDGLYRITASSEPISTFSVDVYDSVVLIDRPSFAADTLVLISLVENLSLEDIAPFGAKDRNTFYLDNTDYNDASIYRLVEGRWTVLADEDAQNIAGADISKTILDGKLFIVNGRDYNRYIDQDGTTIVTSEFGPEDNGYGNLFNSPRARLVNTFKDRIYLANYDWEGTHNGNTVLQSSLPLGIMALVVDDVTSAQNSDTEHDPGFGVTTTLSNGLIAYYPLNGAGTELVNGYDVTESGTVTWATGRFGEAADLGESNSSTYLSSSDDVGPNGIGGAISLWVKPHSLPASASDEMSLAFFGDNDAMVGYELYLINSAGTQSIGVRQYSPGGSSSTARGTTLPLGEWSHIVVSVDGREAPPADEFYAKTIVLNGTKISLSNPTLSVSVFDCLDALDTPHMNSVSTDVLYVKLGDSLTLVDCISVMRRSSGQTVASGVYLGAYATPSNYASVVLDEVAFYNRNLELWEMQELYNSGNGLVYGYPWKIPVTDTTYFYADEYANEYEVYRINKKVADVTIMDVDDLNIYADNGGITWSDEYTEHQFLSQDQIFPKGGVTGPKKYRWPNSPVLSGENVKQYGTFKLSGGDETDITMLENIGNVMLIANRSVLASWNGATLNNFDLGIGCPSRRGYVKAYGALYFLHYTGVYATSGAVPTITSSPVQPYIDGATKEGIENAVAGKKGRSVFFCIGDVTLYWPDGSIRRELSDVCLEYNILQQTWYVHTNVKATAFETALLGASADVLTLTDGDTKDVKKFLDGTTDDGAEIVFRVDTHPFPLSANIEDISNPQLVIVESERGASMQCFISLNDQDYFQIEGKIDKGISRLPIQGRDQDRGAPPIARYMSVSFRDSSKQICKLGKVSVTFLPAGVPNPNGDSGT